MKSLWFTLSKHASILATVTNTRSTTSGLPQLPETVGSATLTLEARPSVLVLSFCPVAG